MLFHNPRPEVWPILLTLPKTPCCLTWAWKAFLTAGVELNTLQRCLLASHSHHPRGAGGCGKLFTSREWWLCPLSADLQGQLQGTAALGWSPVALTMARVGCFFSLALHLLFKSVSREHIGLLSPCHSAPRNRKQMTGKILYEILIMAFPGF